VERTGSRCDGLGRKRGKIEEFNRVLRGATDTSFQVRFRIARCTSIRYCLTLDSDTRLRDVARKLVGIILHPQSAQLVRNRGA